MGWPSTTANNAITDTGLVIHYNGNTSWKLASKRCDAADGCRGYWTWCRNFHVQSRKWRDVGYSFFVCPHGNEYVGRGYNKEQAAQPGGNITWTSVTTALGAGEEPTHAQINGIRRLRARLMRRGMKGAVTYHGKFISTSCPGTILIALVKEGIFGVPPEGEEPVFDMGTLPMLRMGNTGYDIKTVRALLFARGHVNVPDNEPPEWLETFLNDIRFTPELEQRIIKYQKAVFPEDSEAWDGIIGDKTWAKLERRRTS